MTKHNVALVVPFLAVALVVPSTHAQQTVRPQPPVAKKVPHETKIHGFTLKDDYFWLREKSNPEVIKHLEERERLHRRDDGADEGAPGNALQRDARPHQADRPQRAVSRIGDYWYYSRTEEGKQYPYQCRRKGSMQGTEEILLDLNKLAEGHTFLGLGAYVVSDDGNLLAYSTDTTGYRQYTLHVKDLRTGQTLPEAIERIGSIVWATDNKTLFYTTEDAVSKRATSSGGTRSGADKNDLLYEEKDELFDVGAGRSLDKKVIFLARYAKTSTRGPLPAGRHAGRRRSR